MTNYYQDDQVTLYHGDALDVLKTMGSESVDCIVTSPPYFGLRDYGVDGQIGAEASPAEFVENLRDVFTEARRVMADDGTLWLNLGDSYDRKSKNLLGIPWRVAFALQDDGWILRNDIIWAKPNGMPESVTDRLSNRHEHLFMFSKKPRYWFDLDPIRQPLAPSSVSRLAQDVENQVGTERANGGAKTNGNLKAVGDPARGANPGDWWVIPTQPFSEAHFATFPPALPERCILASTRPAGRKCDCDAEIGTPTGKRAGDDPTATIGRAGMSRPRGDSEGRRVVTRRTQRHHANEIRTSPHRAKIEAMVGHAFAHYIRTDNGGARPLPPALMDDLLARGWITEPQPCDCPEMPADTVLDPFSGSGTTGLAAAKHGRRYVGIDLNHEYLDLSLRTRLQQPGLDLGSVS